jgi:hypothetical protein
MSRAIMTAQRFILYFVTTGVFLPATWLAFYWTPGKAYPESILWLMLHARLDSLLLMFWPSSILMIADPGDKSVALPLIAISLNAVLYAILGWLFWIGLKRSRIVLAATVVSILAGWYGLLHL